MNIIKLDSVNSTNTYCNYLITNPNGLPENIRPDDRSLPVAVIADEQYAGRGRYGRDFYSPSEKGIYLSYAFEGHYAESDLLQITMVVASLVHQVLSKYCSEELNIKWINDIYRGSHKISGILVERVDDPTTGKYYLIVGVGINLVPSEVPSELSGIIGFLRDDADDDIRTALTDELITTLDCNLGKCRTDNFPALVEYYKSNCYNLPADFGNELLN